MNNHWTLIINITAQSQRYKLKRLEIICLTWYLTFVSHDFQWNCSAYLSNYDQDYSLVRYLLPQMTLRFKEYFYLQKNDWTPEYTNEILMWPVFL